MQMKTIQMKLAKSSVAGGNLKYDLIKTKPPLLNCQLYVISPWLKFLICSYLILNVYEINVFPLDVNFEDR